MSEEMAKDFHETYERLAPDFSYETRKASAVPWEDVPENNKKLMIAVAGEMRARHINDIATGRKLFEAERNAAFYKSCALSGEVPSDGDEPYPQDKGDDV